MMIWTEAKFEPERELVAVIAAEEFGPDATDGDRELVRAVLIDEWQLEQRRRIRRYRSLADWLGGWFYTLIAIVATWLIIIGIVTVARWWLI